MINKVTLIGNLGRDPEVRHLDNGAAVAKMSLATNESYRDKNGEWQTNTEWHEVVMWRSLAERAQRSLKKGSLIYVDGKLTHRKYQDKDGNDRYITEVVANTFRSLERREGGRQDMAFPSASDAPTQYTPAKNSGETVAPSSEPIGGTVTSSSTQLGDDDDLPF